MPAAFVEIFADAACKQMRCEILDHLFTEFTGDFLIPQV